MLNAKNVVIFINESPFLTKVIVVLFFLSIIGCFDANAIELKSPSQKRGDVRAPTATVLVSEPTVQNSSLQRVTASAVDDVGVVKTEIYINGMLLCAQPAALATCSWEVPAVPNRSYIIQGKAYDAGGNVGSSTGTIVTSR